MVSPFRRIVVFVVLAVVGFALLPALRVELQPQPSAAALTVRYSLPQSAPEVVEAQATAPLENVLSQLRGLKKIASVSGYDAGSITLHFDQNTDMDFARLEVASLIRRSYPSLSRALSYPQIVPGGTQRKDALPLLTYSIHAPYTPTDIYRTIDECVRKPISQLEGVAEVQLQGADKLGVCIAYYPEKLALYHLSVQDITTALAREQSHTHLGGHLTKAGERIHYRIEPQISNLNDIAKIPLAAQTTEIASRPTVRLADVAEIYWEEQARKSYFRVNGQNAITLNIIAHPEVNQLRIAGMLRVQMKHLEQALPQGYVLLLEYDNTKYIQAELHKIYYRSGAVVLILLGLSWLLYRQLSSIFILLSSLVITLGLTSIGVYVLGITLHLYSLAGLTLSLGLVLNNTIIMLAHWQQPQTSSLVRASLGASLCIILGVGVVFGLPEEERMQLGDFATAIMLNMAASWVVAVGYTPAMAAALGIRVSPLPLPESSALFRGYRRLMRGLQRVRWGVYTALILAFGLPVFILPTKIEGWEWYNRSLGNAWYLEHIRPVIDKGLGGALRLFVQEVYTHAGYREPQSTRLQVQLAMPQGTTLEHTNQLVQEIEAVIAETAHIAKYVTRVSSEREASIQVLFTAQGEKEGVPYALKQKIVAQSLYQAGAMWTVYGVGEGFSTGESEGASPTFRVEMKGYNYAELEKQAQILAEKLKTHKRIQTVNTNERVSYQEKTSEEWVLRPHTQARETAIITGAQVMAGVSQYTPVTYPQIHLSLADKLTPVLIESIQARAFNLQSLWLNTITANDVSFRVADFGRIDTLRTTNALHRENRQYVRIVSFEYFGSAAVGEKFLDKQLAEMRQIMPVGYEAKKLSYRFFDWEQMQRQYGLLAALLAIIFILCSIMFESLSKPFWVIVTVPISLIGVFLAFAWFNIYFDQGGYAAFFLLSGLVVNSAIYMVNDYRDTSEAQVFEMIWHKSTPILLTICANVLGVLPFLTEGEGEVFWFSLAVATIGGLLFSVVAIFIVLPLFMLNALRSRVNGAISADEQGMPK